ncbi:hypothetical protein, partial [Pseudomonas sp. NPDC086251]
GMQNLDQHLTQPNKAKPPRG